MKKLTSGEYDRNKNQHTPSLFMNLKHEFLVALLLITCLGIEILIKVRRPVLVKSWQFLAMS